MKRPAWILRETVLALHERLLAEFGGSSGVRDQGLRDSALARPENLNGTIVDGNKRTGFAAAVLFLELNGHRFEASEADATIQTLALAAGAIDEPAYAAWLKANSRRARF